MSHAMLSPPEKSPAWNLVASSRRCSRIREMLASSVGSSAATSWTPPLAVSVKMCVVASRSNGITCAPASATASWRSASSVSALPHAASAASRPTIVTTKALRDRIGCLFQQCQRFEHIALPCLRHSIQQLGEPLRSRLEDLFGDLAAKVGEQYEADATVGAIRVLGPPCPRLGFELVDQSAHRARR